MAEMSQLKMEGMNEEVLMEDSRYLHANEQCWKMIDYLSLSFSVDHIVYCDNEETSLRAAVVAPVAVAKGTVLHMGVAACTAFLFVTGSFDRAIWVFICLIFLNLYFLHCIHQPVTSQDPPRAGVVFLLKAIVGCASIYHCYTYPLFDFSFLFSSFSSFLPNLKVVDGTKKACFLIQSSASCRKLPSVSWFVWLVAPLVAQ